MKLGRETSLFCLIIGVDIVIEVPPPNQNIGGTRLLRPIGIDAPDRNIWLNKAKP